MSESGILTAHLRQQVSEEALREELARWLGLATEDLVPLDRATPATLVPYQYTQRSRGFLVTIEVYAGRLAAFEQSSDLALGKHLARQFAQDVLVSPTRSESPYRWLLLRPDGTTTSVLEAACDEEEDGIVIVEPAAE
jgi:hypothetical protein